MITLHDAEWIRLSSFSGYSAWPKYFSRKIFINSSSDGKKAYTKTYTNFA